MKSPKQRNRQLLVPSTGLSRMASVSALIAVLGATPALSASAARTASPQAQSHSQKAAGYLNAAIRDFQVCQYKKAEIELREAIAEDPASATAHYYLADTLVYLNRHDEAMEEFKRSYRLDPYGPVSGYCRKALLTYNTKVAEPEAEDEPLQATESMKRYFFSDPKAPSKEKVAAIHDQAEREKLRHKQVGESLTKAYNTTAECEAQSIQRNARDEIDAIINGRMANSPYPQDRQIAATRADAVQKNADEMARIAKARAEQRQVELKLYSKQRIDLVDEAVANLEKNLITKNLAGTPELQHAGTDLFVRNYSPAKRQPQYPDPHPATARINPASPDEVNAARAEQKRLQVEAPGVKREVRGQVVPNSD